MLLLRVLFYGYLGFGIGVALRTFSNKNVKVYWKYNTSSQKELKGIEIALFIPLMVLCWPLYWWVKKSETYFKIIPW